VDLVDDIDAWNKYPHHHKFFNKLWLAEKLGHSCGPASIPVPEEGYYIVRPIYNLRGMGIHTMKLYLRPDVVDTIRPGFFWCKQFEGIHFTFDLKFNWAGPPFWKVIRGYRCEKRRVTRGQTVRTQKFEFTKFTKEPLFGHVTLPHFFHELSDVGTINIEMIDDKIIETHLRSNPDPGDGKDYDEMIPVWQNEKVISDQYLEQGYTWIESFDDADNQLANPRLGFLVK